MTILSVSNLSVRFRAGHEQHVDAVKDVSFDVRPGEMLALVGESGSGKSLTALSVLQLTPPSATLSGSIRFEGQELMATGEGRLTALRGSRIGMVFQEPMTALNPLHRIGRQIGEAIAVHQGRTRGRGLLRDQDVKARVLTLLEEVGLAHFSNRLDAYPHQLSGGERQRVMIAMAMANRPALLIADEPTTAVDVTVQKKILALLKQLQKQQNLAMLFITHDLTLVRRMADRVAVMKAGEIVEMGAVNEVFVAPKHPYTRQLLDSAPKGTAVMAPKERKVLMEAEKLSVRYPLHKKLFEREQRYAEVLNGFHLQVEQGTTLGIVGESGSGKTTVMLALLRLIKSEGRIVFAGTALDGLNARQMRAYRKDMQMVFQDAFASLNPRMTVQQIVEEGLRVHEPSLNTAQRGARVAEALTEVGLLPEMMHRYPHEFSGGQRQRIGIARALVLRPKLIALDEPTSALDLTVQAQIVSLLKELQVRHGLTYLFISHDLRVIRAIAHRLLVLRRGHVEEEGETAQVLGNPRSDYTKALIEAAMLDIG